MLPTTHTPRLELPTAPCNKFRCCASTHIVDMHRCMCLFYHSVLVAAIDSQLLSTHTHNRQHWLQYSIPVCSAFYRRTWPVFAPGAISRKYKDIGYSHFFFFRSYYTFSLDHASCPNRTSHICNTSHSHRRSDARYARYRQIIYCLFAI